MSTNICYTEQIIYHGGLHSLAHAFRCWGWYVGTSTDARTITVAGAKSILFALEKTVRGVLKRAYRKLNDDVSELDLDDWDLDMTTAFVIACAKADSEDADWFFEVLHGLGILRKSNGVLRSRLVNLIQSIPTYPAKGEVRDTLELIRAIPNHIGDLVEMKP